MTSPAVTVRRTRPEDFREIIEISRALYHRSEIWTLPELRSHLDVFPEGQFVAVDAPSGKVVGMAASLIVVWDDYEFHESWADFTASGMFTNHDPERGRTLYGAEVMVLPSMQGRGVGGALYLARRDLARRLELRRIRAGARLTGYHEYAHALAAQVYVRKVVAGELRDPTLSFQLSQDFRVLAVVSDYLPNDPESLGYAALVEWLNPDAPNHHPRASAG